MMASRITHTVDENMENVSPTKNKTVSAANRSIVDASNRPVLGDLTPNTPISSRLTNEGGGKKSMSLSPLKRGHGDVLNQERGFTYLKRRRLSQDQQQANKAPLFRRDQQRHDGMPNHQSPPRSRPLSPPSSAKDGAISSGISVAQDKVTTDDPQQPEKESDEDSGRESQKSNNTRGSFSSLINYDPSSQQALASQALNFVAPSVAAHTTHTPARYSHSLSNTIRAHAQILRLRLRVAMYKIRTNQINVPFSRLRVPKSPSPTPVSRAHHAHPTARQSRPAPAQRPLPTPARAARMTVMPDSDLPYGPGPMNAPDTTPNVFSNRYMPMQRAPSSSPPLIHIPPSSLPRYPMAGVGGGGGGGGNGGGDDTPLMGRAFPDHDSLDSEATELAEDMHDGHEHAESPSKNRRSLFTAGLPR